MCIRELTVLRIIHIDGLALLVLALRLEIFKELGGNEFAGVDINDINAVLQSCRKCELARDEAVVICPLLILGPGVRRLEGSINCRFCCLVLHVLIAALGVELIEGIKIYALVQVALADVGGLPVLAGSNAGLALCFTRLHGIFLQVSADKAARIAEAHRHLDAIVTENLRMRDCLALLSELAVPGQRIAGHAAALSRILALGCLAVDGKLQGRKIEAAGLRNIYCIRNLIASLRGDLILAVGLDVDNGAVNFSVDGSSCRHCRGAAQRCRRDHKRRESRDEFLHDNLILSGLISEQPRSRSQTHLFILFCWI